MQNVDHGLKKKTEQPLSIFYSPASIVSIINAGIALKEEKKIIQIRGIYKKTGTANYSGFFYDRLKDEASDYQITLLTPALLHNKLDDNKTIECNAYISRRIDKAGRIEIQINVIDLISQQVNKYSEEELKKLELLNKKISLGNKDLDTLIKNAIFNNHTLRIGVILGRSAIIDHDIRKGMGEAIALYDISYHPVSLSAPTDVSAKIEALDNAKFDIICVARGGGENLELFDNLEICEKALGRNAVIASAIGHEVDVTLFEKIADKKFSLPFHFGSYLKEIYNTTVEDFESSKAKIIQDVEIRLNTEYAKKMDTLNQQIVSMRELNQKQLADTQTNYREKTQLHQQELSNLKEQVRSLNATQAYKDGLINQANDLAARYKDQAEAAVKNKSVSTLSVIVFIIVGIIIGFIISLLFNK